MASLEDRSVAFLGDPVNILSIGRPHTLEYCVLTEFKMLQKLWLQKSYHLPASALLSLALLKSRTQNGPVENNLLRRE